jgi:hypothetical protein
MRLSATAASVGAMDFSVPLSVVLRVTGFTKPKYLVLQTQARGVSAEEVVVYAETFYTRKQAEKAASEANSRVFGKLGMTSDGTRRWAEMYELPLDDR